MSSVTSERIRVPHLSLHWLPALSWLIRLSRWISLSSLRASCLPLPNLDTWWKRTTQKKEATGLPSPGIQSWWRKSLNALGQYHIEHSAFLSFLPNDISMHIFMLRKPLILHKSSLVVMSSPHKDFLDPNSMWVLWSLTVNSQHACKNINPRILWRKPLQQSNLYLLV